MRRIAAGSLTLSLLAVLHAFPAAAVTWYVPAQAPTIAAGVDSAAAGDTVLVACGTYFERNIDVPSGICLRSESRQADGAVLDGEGLDRVLWAQSVTDMRLQGFTITGGYRNWGAGISLNDSPIEIADCLFAGNTATWQGGGLLIEYCDPVLRNVTVAGNAAPQGSGMYVYFAAPIIENALVALNDGLSVWCSTQSAPQFSCSDIWGNSAGDWQACIADQLGQDGNIWADPLFCDPPADPWTLDAASPCLPANNDCGELMGALGQSCAVVAVPGEEPGAAGQGRMVLVK